MTSVSINVDGTIDLIDLAEDGELPERARADTDRARKSRLADVMIVMERDREALEAALRARLDAGALPDGVARLALELDASAPHFTVAVEPVEAFDAATGESVSDRLALLESEIAAEIEALIDQRATTSAKPRWRPDVTTTVRKPESAVDAAHQERLEKRAGSIWLRILFWLLASMILATAYLYMKGMPT